ncbi:hypothetical protein [Campylobacter sp. CCUG 57310]|uniref:rolling circle replication-associated protein n=1 Tax=Campylobacter sp. CCUG 57310 TaxID=2517362 RepID=UPI00156491AE|nr:hypothetical protein [Campylobacter sp. CCUG 57310]QKF91750.1 putative phage replication initiation protein [Campylobacter sp. CCUG 57310]
MYGITDFDLLQCQNKLEKQKGYLLSQGYVNSLGECKTLLDCSMAANFSDKYYAEVSNRVNTMASFSIDLQQKPVFLTITLNGCFRDALNGDYSRFKPIDWKYIPHIIKSRMKNGEKIEIRDLVAILNHQWRLFFRRFGDKYKKTEYSYIRCFEPHKKDGVPHIHALFYVPGYTIDYMLKIYKDLFNAPQNLKTNAITPEQERNGELNGFQTSIQNPSGYVMKYIQKTFINLKETEELDELSAWYIKHKVRRFLSSRTKVPLWVYRKINFISDMQDLYHLNDHKNDDDAILEWNYLDQYIYIKFPKLREELIYLDGTLEYYRCNKLIHTYSLERQQHNKTPYRADGKCPNSNEMTLQREIREFKKWKLEYYGQINKPVNRMKNYELYQYYSNLDKQNCNLRHLAYVENLMIDRNLETFTKQYEKHNLNAPVLEDFISRGLRQYEF